jgi:hypothetical protein
MIDAIGSLVQTVLELVDAWCKPTTIGSLAKTSPRENEKLTEKPVVDH